MPAPDPTAIDVAPDAEIGQKLKRAKAAGAAVRARISVTMGLAGGALVAVLVAAVAIAGAADTIRAVNYAALLCIGIPGPPLLLLAVLPTDRLVIYGVAAVCCAVSLVCAALIAARVKKRQEAEWKAVQYVMVVGFVSVAAVVGSAARLPPRAALRRTWICLGVAYFAAALIFLYTSVTRVNPGMKPGSREHQFWWLATAELFVLGAVSSWPSFRQRVHAALLARGGQISSAASVAALLGRNDIDHVKAEAQRKFYGVELSQVRLEDMQQSTPDPALFARARHARFDEIDWFISHSWHDSPEAKYSALQAARTSFVKDNKREPVVSSPCGNQLFFRGPASTLYYINRSGSTNFASTRRVSRTVSCASRSSSRAASSSTCSAGRRFWNDCGACWRFLCIWRWAVASTTWRWSWRRRTTRTSRSGSRGSTCLTQHASTPWSATGCSRPSRRASAASSNSTRRSRTSWRIC